MYSVAEVETVRRRKSIPRASLRRPDRRLRLKMSFHISPFYSVPHRQPGMRKGNNFLHSNSSILMIMSSCELNRLSSFCSFKTFSHSLACTPVSDEYQRQIKFIIICIQSVLYVSMRLNVTYRPGLKHG